MGRQENKKVLCLMGGSGSGKTTIGKELEKLGCNVIQSYTTRVPRHEREWGHIFCMNRNTTNDFEIDKKKKAIFFTLLKKSKCGFRNCFAEFKDVVAYAEHYGEHYFSLNSQFLVGEKNLYIVCPQGASDVIDYYEKENVTCIYLNSSEKDRANVLSKRGEDRNVNGEFKNETIKRVTDHYITNDRSKTPKEIAKEILKLVDKK